MWKCYPKFFGDYHHMEQDIAKFSISCKVHGKRSKFSVQVTGNRISYQKPGSNSACSILSKFLVPDKTIRYQNA